MNVSGAMSIIMKECALTRTCQQHTRPVSNRVKTHSLWVSISESFYMKTCTVFPMSFHWCSAWFKHILLLSTKGLGVAKLRCKPSPNRWCIWLLYRWTKVCYWHVIWTFDLHKMIKCFMFEIYELRWSSLDWLLINRPTMSYYDIL